MVEECVKEVSRVREEIAQLQQQLEERLVVRRKNELIPEDSGSGSIDPGDPGSLHRNAFSTIGLMQLVQGAGRSFIDRLTPSHPDTNDFAHGSASRAISNGGFFRFGGGPRLLKGF